MTQEGDIGKKKEKKKKQMRKEKKKGQYFQIGIDRKKYKLKATLRIILIKLNIIIRYFHQSDRKPYY